MNHEERPVEFVSGKDGPRKMAESEKEKVHQERKRQPRARDDEHEPPRLGPNGNSQAESAW
ncbi:uncharacterized protein N7459_006294 [Penicillium hispanicum]|uniref:uncharacterized protein n=1 Tax=Penicillium hispanicum TaxID=1080232 RepID=UPI00253FF34F|nr:uncharacterized protein N7459_006294 [Penicillium hispanicum]KAJ5580309.1 hypothetical protein N7459_006294 [Penicillium hispanicum]